MFYLLIIIKIYHIKYLFIVIIYIINYNEEYSFYYN